MGHPSLRHRAISLAQKLHKIDVWLDRRGVAASERKKVFVATMTDDTAIKLASKFVSESFIYMVGTAVLGYEYHLSSIGNAAKTQQAMIERRALDERLTELEKKAHEESHLALAETKRVQGIIQELQDRLEKVEDNRGGWWTWASRVRQSQS